MPHNPMDDSHTSNENLNGEKDFPSEDSLVTGICQGDSAAFARIFAQYQASLLRVAMAYVGTRALAEEVVQETWAGVIKGLGGFERRSSLRTWIFRILVNQAKRYAQREWRYRSCSSSDEPGSNPTPSADPSRFIDSGKWKGHWISLPTYWDDQTPEKVVLAKESVSFVYQCIDMLPAVQRQVIILRDIEGLSSNDVCQVLDIREANQRVLLHRARSKVRAALEQHLKGESQS